MAYDDIFDEIRKMMNRNFKGFFNDDPFGFEEMKPSDEEKTPKEVKLNTKKTAKNPIKSYSISYTFGTGMKEPKIEVSGDVDPSIVKRFLSGVPKINLPANLDGKYIDLLKPKLHGLEEEKDEEISASAQSKENHEEESSAPAGCDAPFCDIIDTNDGALITLEMPGIGAGDVKYEIMDNTVKVHAENGNRKYNQEVALDFKPIGEPSITAINGIVSIELKKSQ